MVMPMTSSAITSRTLLIFGAGYVGQRVARRAIQDGFHVVGTTRSPSRAEQLEAEGVQPLLYSGLEPMSEASLGRVLPSVTHVLSTVPPSLGRDPVLDLQAEMLRTRLPALEWLGQLSSADVYGAPAAQQPEPSWIDESTPPRPLTPASRLRLAIEREWASLELPLHTFRLAEVYGPSRGPQELVRGGTATAIEAPGHTTSRVHVDDVVQIIAASMRAPNPGAVYNVADGEPAPPANVLRLAARLLCAQAPRTVAYDEVKGGLSATARAFWSTPCKLRAAAATEQLGLQLLYPTYRQGLEATLAGEGVAVTGAGEAMGHVDVSGPSGDGAALSTADEAPAALEGQMPTHRQPPTRGSGLPASKPAEAARPSPMEEMGVEVGCAAPSAPHASQLLTEAPAAPSRTAQIQKPPASQPTPQPAALAQPVSRGGSVGAVQGISAGGVVAARGAAALDCAEVEGLVDVAGEIAGGVEVPDDLVAELRKVCLSPHPPYPHLPFPPSPALPSPPSLP